MLASTGASKVDLVGWSQGGMMPRYYLENLGGASKVNALIGLAPSNHGTTLSGLATLAGYFPGALPLVGALCPACTDQVVGSPFLMNLNAGGDTVAGVKYTVIQSRYDEVVTPYTSAFLTGSNVTNITIQNKCILDLGDHLSMPYDHIVDREVLNALDPAHASSTICTPITPAVGGRGARSASAPSRRGRGVAPSSFRVRRVNPPGGRGSRRDRRRSWALTWR